MPALCTWSAPPSAARDSRATDPRRKRPRRSGASDIWQTFAVTSNSIANPPASVGIANAVHAAAAARSGRYHDRRARRHHHRAWRDIGSAYAVEISMPAGSTAAGGRDGQSRLCLAKRCERHGLGNGRTEDADADNQSERKKFSHSFLLCFAMYVSAPELLHQSSRRCVTCNSERLKALISSA
jgi:hypothetical protein